MSREEFVEITKERWDNLGIFSTPRLMQYVLFFVFCINCLFLSKAPIQTWQVYYLIGLSAICLSHLSFFIVSKLSSGLSLEECDIAYVIWGKVLWESTKFNFVAVFLRCVWDMFFQ